MDGDTLYPIGELARRTGLTVKAIRFYSDRGIVLPTDRSPAGYRLYDIDAVARLDLVRTLRELGLDLSTVRKVLTQEATLADVAAAHAEALAVQIRTLRLRRAVMTAVVKRGSTPEEMDLMHKLAKLSEDERRRLIDDFLNATFGGLVGSDFVGITHSITPELPDEPEAEQVEAWVALAELSKDPDFRSSVRRMAVYHASERVPGGAALRRDPIAAVRDFAGPALRASIDPASSRADSVVAAVMVEYAQYFERPDEVDLQRRLLTRLEAANIPRWEEYLRLLAVINGWPVPEELTPALDWFSKALQARISE